MKTFFKIMLFCIALYLLADSYYDYKTPHINNDAIVKQENESLRRGWEILSIQEKEYIAKGLKTSVDKIDNQITKCLAIIAIFESLEDNDKTKEREQAFKICEKFLNTLHVVYR